jgi:hypothetical protein
MPADRLAAIAAEATALLAGYAAAAALAIGALGEGDDARARAALDERDALRERLAPLLEGLVAARLRMRSDPALAGDARALGALVALVERQAARAAEVDEALSLAAARRRDAIADELDRLEHDAAVRAAYGRRAGGRARLDRAG